jgi:hypothetical protein
MNNYKEAGVDEKCTPCPANHITLADGAASIRECVRKFLILDNICWSNNNLFADRYLNTCFDFDTES